MNIFRVLINYETYRSFKIAGLISSSACLSALGRRFLDIFGCLECLSVILMLFLRDQSALLRFYFSKTEAKGRITLVEHQ